MLNDVVMLMVIFFLSLPTVQTQYKFRIQLNCFFLTKLKTLADKFWFCDQICLFSGLLNSAYFMTFFHRTALRLAVISGNVLDLQRSPKKEATTELRAALIRQIPKLSILNINFLTVSGVCLKHLISSENIHWAT